MPVGLMLRSLTSAELTEYMAFDAIEPIGDRRQDLLAGLLAATFINHSVAPPKHPVTVGELMPKFDWSPPQVVDDPKARAAQIRALLNSKAHPNVNARKPGC